MCVCVHLGVALVVGEVDHHEQLQIGLGLGQQGGSGGFTGARPELHIALVLHRLEDTHFCY